MQGTRRKPVIAGLVVLFLAVLVYVLRSGPHPETGKCVDGGGALVGCDTRAALYKLAKEVKSGRECPADASKLYAFRDSMYCGVALRGAPVPRPEYVPCLLLAGAQLARSTGDLAFARGFAASPASASEARSGRIKVRGDDWRIFYVLHEGQLDPGLGAIVADPGKVVFVAYITGAAEHRREVAAATRCGRATPRPAPAPA
jgi:hypothetical protein